VPPDDDDDDNDDDDDGQWFVVVNQVTHELMSYDAMADGPYQHTWWYNDFGGQWEKTVFFPTATTGMDTNTTVDVCPH